MSDLVPATQPAGNQGSILTPLTDPAGGNAMSRMRAFAGQGAVKRMVPWFLGVAAIGAVALTYSTLAPAPQRTLYSGDLFIWASPNCGNPQKVQRYPREWAEALRLLGPAVGEGLALAGPVVLVEARLPATAFVSKDRSYDYHDGMRGRGEVRVRAVTLLEALVPALERL